MAIPMVNANLPAVVLERSGLLGKRLLHVSAVPTHAFPIVSGICGRMSIMNAIQKSCKEGETRFIAVGPIEKL